MSLIDVSEAAERLGISTRQVQHPLDTDVLDGPVFAATLVLGHEDRECAADVAAQRDRRT